MRRAFPDVAWGYTEELLAQAVEQLRVANWMQTKDGADGRNPPARIPRPASLEQPVGRWTVEELDAKFAVIEERRRASRAERERDGN